MMERYIAILRGINVSGQKLIKMAELKEILEAAGFGNVLTYIQSGNIIFTSPEKKENSVASKVRKVILDRFGFEVPVIIRRAADLKRILSANPFPREKGIQMDKLHVTFLSDEPESTGTQVVEKMAFGAERFVISGKEIYLYTPDGYGNTKLSNTFFENKLKVTATTRNWATVNKLAELSSGI